MSDEDTCNARLCNFGRAGGRGDVYADWDKTAGRDSKEDNLNTDGTANSIFNQLQDKDKEAFANLKQAAGHIKTEGIIERLRNNIINHSLTDESLKLDSCLPTDDIYVAKNTAPTGKKEGFRKRKTAVNGKCIAIAIIVGLLVGLLLILGLYIYKCRIRKMKDSYVENDEQSAPNRTDRR
jgi:hypothetical protein